MKKNNYISLAKKTASLQINELKKIKSVLLPGEFFKNDFIVKTNKLMSLDIDTIYLFDHGKNPAGSDLDVYELIDGIYKLNEVVNGQIRLGVCVLNINARPFQELFEEYIYKFLEIKNFKLGIGTGDDKFEKRPNFSNDIEKIINEIVDSNMFRQNNISLFIGGHSEKKRGVLSTAFGACITVFLHPGSGLIQGLDKVRDTRARVRRGDGRKPRVTSMTACRVRRFSLVTRAFVAIRRFGG